MQFIIKFRCVCRDGSSRLMISGKENLGDGLSAVFKIDQRFRVDEYPNSLQASGNTFVGLNSPYGNIGLGKYATHYCYGQDEHESRATSFQASSCGLLGFVGSESSPIANATRSINALRYEMPSVAGFRGSLTWSPSWEKGVSEGVGEAGKGYALAGQLEYATKVFQVGGSFWNGKTENRALGQNTADQNAYTLAGKFNFGFATAGLTWDQSKITNNRFSGISPVSFDSNSIATQRSAWSIPVTIPLGLGTALFTYTKANALKVGNETLSDSGASLLSVGYDYALSKRTSLGVSYAMLNNQRNAQYGFFNRGLTGLAAPLAGQDQRQLYLGVLHRF